MSETIPAADNDSSIPDSEVLYRRVPGSDDISTTWDHNQGRLRPSSAAFDDDVDGMSVFLLSVIEKLGLTAAAVIDGHPGYLVAGLIAGSVRAEGMGVIPDPDPANAPPHPCNPAHALVTTGHMSGKARRKAARNIAKIAELIDVQG
jgi:hypothetical protein